MNDEARHLRQFLSARLQDLTGALDSAELHQRRMLPLPPPARPGLRIATFYQPARRLSGDYLDLIALDRGASGILIADVVGHGPQAALYTSMLRTLLMIPGRSSRSEEPEQVLGSMNDIACEVLRGSGLFVTAVYATFAPETGRLSFANAGHPCPVLLGATGPAQVLKGASIPLGIRTGIMFKRLQHTLDPGDRLLLTTDGLGEQRRCGSEERYGIDRVVELMERHRTLPIELWLRFLVSSIEDWCADALPEDDMSAVLLEIGERCSSPVRSRPDTLGPP